MQGTERREWSTLKLCPVCCGQGAESEPHRLHPVCAWERQQYWSMLTLHWTRTDQQSAPNRM
eukprot:COSAG01_NODE_65597_length_272_cov_82.699422_1_plen_61_part_10